MNILHIQSSLFGNQGQSSQLSGALVAQLNQKVFSAKTLVRNLAENPLPQLDAELMGKIQNGQSIEADQVIREVQNANLLVIGAPMYNFSMPTQLKTWFDLLARAGTTFRYTENGPEGLLKNKEAVVVTSRGGIHKDAASDALVPLMTTLLNFVGIEDITFIYAEGLNMEGVKDTNLEQVKEQIDALADQLVQRFNTQEEVLA